MTVDYEFGPSIKMTAKKMVNGTACESTVEVAAEIPFTININDNEIATLLCSPDHLKEFTYGFLFNSRLIKQASDISRITIDTRKWLASVEMSAAPDAGILEKRLFTSGCGKGVMYASVQEIAMRPSLHANLTLGASQICSLSKWLNHSSALFKATGGVHTAALSRSGEIPEIVIDDVGRHNAVDKVIGHALINRYPLSEYVLISSGRTSSEILYKARVCEVPITLSRGAPTHQAILKARDMGITLVGFARGSNFTVYSHDNRINFNT